MSDFVLGTLVLILGCAIFASASELAPARHIKFGPGFLPSIIAVGLVLCGSTLMIRDVVTNGRPKFSISLPDWDHTPGWTKKALLLGAALVIYPIILPIAGFLIATPIFLSLLLRAGAITWPRAIVLSTITTALAQLVFVDVLGVPMPWGVLQNFQIILTVF